MKLTSALRIAPTIALAGCLGSEAPGADQGFEIAVAPLTLPGLSKVCYDLRVTNGADGGGSTVFAKGNPSLDGAADTGSLCSTQFGNGGGGGITFVGACDASPVNAGDTGRTNSVTLWVDSLYATGGAQIAENGPDGWQDPCPTGCTLNALCQENTDTRVEFNLTILRQANQGFFDIGVNFEDIFCSAKIDCVDANNAPLKLLFRPGTSTRDTTVVAAFACTAGAGSGINTHLYRNPLKITCGSTVTELAPNSGKGNAWATSSADPNAADAIWQYAIYADNEELTCGGQPCSKRYWNVAIGLDPTVDNCTLTTRMTASAGALNLFTTPTANTYPFIDINVPLTDTTGLTCTKHPLDGSNGVSTSYTPIATPAMFKYAYDGTTFQENLTGIVLYLDAGNSASYPGTGSTWFDLSGKNHHGALVGVSYSADNGGSFYFDGSTDYVINSTFNITPTNNEMTISMWYRTTNNATEKMLIDLCGLTDTTNNRDFFSIRQNWASNNKISGYFKSTAGWNSVAWPNQVVTNTWNHIVYTKVGNTLNAYLNGVKVASNPSVSGNIRTIERYIIGEDNLFVDKFQGYISQVQVYTRSFSDADVTQAFNALRGRYSL